MANYCNKCGAWHSPEAKRCDNCGQPIVAKQNPNPPPPPPSPLKNKAQSQIMANQFNALGTLLRQYPTSKLLSSFNPFQKINCPYCNLRFHPSDCAIYSSMRTDVVLRPAPTGEFQQFFARFHTIKLDGPEYLQEDACHQCPRCKKLLPYRFDVDKNFSIAIVGHGTSGKSHYIAALLYQLKSGEILQEGNVHVRFAPMNKETELIFKDYQKTLFTDHDALPGTIPFSVRPGEQIVRKPLIFQLTIGYTVQGQYINNVMNLIFYDISGEDITNQDNMKQFGWPILQSQAIIYLVDPLGMKPVLDKLDQLLPADLQVKKSKPLIANRPTSQVILDNVMEIFDRYTGRSPGEKVKTPVAVMVSKSDVLDPILRQNAPQNTRFLQDAVYDGTVNEWDMKIVDQEVRDFLVNFGEQRLISATQRFLNVSFFATSATGGPPDEHNKFKEVKPRRCLDPLFWVLWKLTTSSK